MLTRTHACTYGTLLENIRWHAASNGSMLSTLHSLSLPPCSRRSAFVQSFANAALSYCLRSPTASQAPHVRAFISGHAAVAGDIPIRPTDQKLASVLLALLPLRSVLRCIAYALDYVCACSLCSSLCWSLSFILDTSARARGFRRRLTVRRQHNQRCVQR